MKRNLRLSKAAIRRGAFHQTSQKAHSRSLFVLSVGLLFSRQRAYCGMRANIDARTRCPLSHSNHLGLGCGLGGARTTFVVLRRGHAEFVGLRRVGVRYLAFFPPLSVREELRRAHSRSSQASRGSRRTEANARTEQPLVIQRGAPRGETSSRTLYAPSKRADIKSTNRDASRNDTIRAKGRVVELR